MPRLTQTLGPWIRPSSDGKYSSVLSREMELMKELLGQLPPCASFCQNFHHSITNWLPFYWEGFEQTTRYTYVIEDLSNLEAVWDDLSSKHVRNPIRKAQKAGITVIEGRSFDEFYEVNSKTFSRQAMKNPISKELMRRVYEAALANNGGRLFTAVDEAGAVHAVAFLVWTKLSAYYIAGGADPELRGSGAQDLVLWEAIRFAASVAKAFDFEGSMIAGVESSVRRFGGRQHQYFRVWKDRRSPLEKGMQFVKKAFARRCLGR